jgi:TolB protein
MLLRWPLAILLLVASPTLLHAQDWVHLTAGNDNTSIRLAAANFKGDASAYKQTFDTVLFADLSNAGIFDMVSKSLAPQSTPGTPAEMNLSQWSQAPASAAMVAFGNIGVQGGNLVANGFLDDAKNTQFPQVFAKQYTGATNDDTARQLAHQFADDIIFRLSGGTPGIAESKLFYSKRIGPGEKEIWMMDYDGANQHAVTHLGEDSISPRVSPDNSLVAFSSLGKNGFQISRPPGPPAASSSPSPPPAPAILKSGSLTRKDPSPTASPATRAPTSRPPTTPRPAPRSPGSADVPAFPSST